METDESVSRFLLMDKIKRGGLTLPIGTSVSDFSEEQCAEILSLLRPPIDLPKMKDWPDSLLSVFDPFHSISVPIKYVLRLSHELQNEASSLEEYAADYTDDLIEIHKEQSSGKRLIYEETCHHIHEDICDFLRGIKFLLSAIHMHRDMMFSVPEVTPLVLQALAVLQLVTDRTDDAYFGFVDTLQYFLYQTFIENSGKWHVTVVENESREEITLERYEYAFDTIRDFTKWVEENRIAFKLEELAARLKVYCQIKAENGQELVRIEENMKDERVATLLDKDIVKTIIKTLGTERKKRIQIVKETPYADGGHIGAALVQLKHMGILQHKRPYYFVNPSWYLKTGICPDKNGQ